jgi:hypothetical protein
MDSDPDETVRDLRTEVYELLDDLKELKYSGVDGFARFLETTRDDEATAQIQIQTLRRQKDRTSNPENRFNTGRKVQDQLLRSVAHVVSAFTRRHTQFIAGASTVGPSTGAEVSL